ncbi:MAG: phosphatidylserine decarboxylase [Holosporales bacterium]|jgi:phosphatidylserine decarboxylase|nr:phosphatidylserine decarboxylase [Holosporales bacterium]
MQSIISIDREGVLFAGVFAFAALVGSMLSVHLGWIGALLTVGCLGFFRDPVRVIPNIPNGIISPADGVVLSVTTCNTPAELGLCYDKCRKISIFMSLFDVHINRAPMEGVVQRIIYIPGKFLNASLDKASDLNERQATVLKIDKGQSIAFVQIAGLIGRRIRCDVREGEALKAGQKVGMIRFGSRVDVYLPMETEISVLENQTTIAGETVLGTI